MNARLSTKIAVIVFASVFLSTSVTLFFTLSDMRSLSFIVAETALKLKLKGDIKTANQYLEKYYGALSYKDGQLFDKNSISLSNRFEMVDDIKETLGNTATIFAKKENDFVRIVTNVYKEDGSRAIGTMLGTNSSAYPNIIRGKEYIGNAKILNKQYLTCYHPIFDQNYNIIGIVFIGIPYESVKNVINENFIIAMSKSIGAAVLSLIILLVIALILLKRIFKPIKHSTALLNDIANGDGDLTRRLTVSGKDEISEFSSLFNTFSEKLQNMIRNISSVSNQMITNSTILKNNSQNVTVHANDMKYRSDTVTDATQNANSNMQRISSSAEEMSSAINTVASAIEQMSASLNEVARNCQKESDIVTSAKSHADSTQNTMSQLSNVAAEIGNVIETIRNIATQTDLLALNATIEAAAAGSAGRGFTVVANEVKALAMQTSEATGQIRGQIEKMQTCTKEVIQAITIFINSITEINSVSHTIVAAVEEQSSTVNEISKNVNGVGEAASDIAKNVAQSASELNNISSNINQVHQSISETTEGIQQIDTNSQAVDKLAKELNKIISSFKV